jgi:hypothetical protein
MVVNKGTLTEDKNEMISQCRSAMGQDCLAKAALSYLPKEFPDLTEEAVADLQSRVLEGKLLTPTEDDMIRQCRSAMSREGVDVGNKKRWLVEWQPGITDEEIDHILKNNLYDSVSSWAERFVSTIQATNKPC